MNIIPHLKQGSWDKYPGLLYRKKLDFFRVFQFLFKLQKVFLLVHSFIVFNYCVNTKAEYTGIYIYIFQNILSRSLKYFL